MERITQTDLEQTIADFRAYTAGKRYRTIYADPPWQFQNRTGKVAPEHKRLTRYETMKLEEIKWRRPPATGATCTCGFPTPFCRRDWR